MDEQRHEGATSGPLVAVADPGRADGQPAFDTRLGLLTLVMRLVEVGPVLLLLLLGRLPVDPGAGLPDHPEHRQCARPDVGHQRPGDGPAARDRDPGGGPVGGGDRRALVGRRGPGVRIRGRWARHRRGDARDRPDGGPRERRRLRLGPHAPPVHRHARLAQCRARPGALARRWTLDDARRHAGPHRVPGERHDRLRPGQLRRRGGAGSRARDLHQGHGVGSIDLRPGRQSRGGPPRGDAGPVALHVGVRHERPPRRCRRRAGVRAQQRRVAELRSAGGARLHRCCRHRRGQLPGRPGQRRRTRSLAP